MLNMNCWLAGLTSTLTFEVFRQPIEKLDDLLTKDGYQIITYKGDKTNVWCIKLSYSSNLKFTGGVDEAYFSEATEKTDPVAKQVFDKMIRPAPDRALFEDHSKVMAGRCYRLNGKPQGRKLFIS